LLATVALTPARSTGRCVVAIAMVLDLGGATLQQYDEVIAKIGFTPGDPGGLAGCAWVTKNDDSIRLTDVWRTREECDTFTQEHIIPVTAAVGLREPSQVTYHDVHNYPTAG
jgi:hypothetical protein